MLLSQLAILSCVYEEPVFEDDNTQNEEQINTDSTDESEESDTNENTQEADEDEGTGNESIVTL
ncbi:MAG: hypothetical protein WBB27_04760 [Maribacter sp.]